MGVFFLLPFFMIRFGLLSLLNKDSVKRAAHFAPLSECETGIYWLYQISNLAILLLVCFSRVKYVPSWLFLTGLIVYTTGLILLLLSVVSFSSPSANGFNQNGLYQLSRNPMYVAYFVFFLGCTLLIQSLPLLAFVAIFQITAHWIILSEERWCAQKFGKQYLQYKEKVRRYI